MNKSLLGLLALTSVVSLSSKYEGFHGYVDTNASIEVKNESLETDKQTEEIKNLTDKKVVEAKLNTKLDLGAYFHKNNDLFVFAGFDGLGYMKEKGENDSNYKPNLPENYYFGARADLDVVDNWDLSLFFAHKKGFTEKVEVLDTEKKEQSVTVIPKKEADASESNGEQTKKISVDVYKTKTVEDKPVLKNVLERHLKSKNIKKSDDLLDHAYALENAENDTVLGAVINGEIQKKLKFNRWSSI